MVSDSFSDRLTFDRLVALLPPDRHEVLMGGRDIGEQEGALGELAHALAETRTVVDGVTRGAHCGVGRGLGLLGSGT